MGLAEKKIRNHRLLFQNLQRKQNVHFKIFCGYKSCTLCPITNVTVIMVNSRNNYDISVKVKY